jgi:hypothetical protein
VFVWVCVFCLYAVYVKHCVFSSTLVVRNCHGLLVKAVILLKLSAIEAKFRSQNLNNPTTGTLRFCAWGKARSYRFSHIDARI